VQSFWCTALRQAVGTRASRAFGEANIQISVRCAKLLDFIRFIDRWHRCSGINNEMLTLAHLACTSQ
jgi:hypothetical protein